MKHYIYLFICALLIISCGNEVEEHSVDFKIVNEGVYASGEVYPKDYFILRTDKTERVKEILVHEGSIVKKGDILAILGTVEENEEAKIIQSQIEMAKNNVLDNSTILKEFESKISLAKQKYEIDKINAEKYQELALSKAVSSKEANQMLITSKTSYTEYQNIKNQYKTKKRALLNALLDSKKELLQSKYLLRSYISGKVYSIEKKEGDIVMPEEPIMLIGTDKSFKLELLVDERDISRISKNQEVFFETDIYLGKQFNAKVFRVNPTLQKASRSFKVEAIIKDSTSYFYPQSSVEANIIVKKKEKRMLIPLDYLYEKDSVYIKKDDEVNKIRVTTGTRFKDWIEIKSGLSQGDKILKML